MAVKMMGADFPDAYKLCKQFIITEDDMVKISQMMLREMNLGLASESHSRSSIPCHMSYVQDLPCGKERGRFLALEMWPTNCRLMLVKFGNEKDVYMSSKSIILPHTVAGGRGDELMTFLAENIATFVKDKKVEKDNLPMGVAFAFPLKKKALDIGILVSWTKGFGAQGVVGHDVVHLLRNAVAKHTDIKVNIVGILNHAVGTMIGTAWSHTDCKIGLVVGTDTNAAYVEETENCESYEGDTDKPFMIINTEWSRFGENGHLDFIRNDFDKAVDQDSSNPGMQLYEKCVTTLYLGELVRRVIVKLMKQGVIFTEHNLDYIGIRWKMEMKSLMAIESDAPGEYTKCQEVMDKFRMRNCKPKDLATVRYISETVTERSAKLIACGLACLVNKMKYPEVSIAVDGGIYRLHARYAALLNKHSNTLTNPKYKFQIVIAEDSAGVGAAIVAGLVQEELDRKQSLTNHSK